jgi:hypothetical protein
LRAPKREPMSTSPAITSAIWSPSLTGQISHVKIFYTWFWFSWLDLGDSSLDSFDSVFLAYIRICLCCWFIYFILSICHYRWCSYFILSICHCRWCSHSNSSVRQCLWGVADRPDHISMALLYLHFPVHHISIPLMLEQSIFFFRICSYD